MDTGQAMPIPPDDERRLGAGDVDSDASQLTPLRELQLVEAHRRGDPDALGKLMRGYQRRLYSLCYRMVRDEHEARDLTQDALVKVMEGLDSYDGRSKLSTWVIRVTINCCLSHLRKERLRRHGPLAPAAEASARGPGTHESGELSPPRRIEQDEMRGILLRALGSLDPQMRAVLVLRDMQELNYQGIAAALGIPVGTVKSRLFRARTALRRAAEGELP